jgi:alpha-L-arabinofuranosidase
MIYKDADSKCDTEDEPCDREEICLNCNEYWTDHYGWKCSRVFASFDSYGNTISNFHEYLSTEKYLTQSMKDSILSKSDYLISHYKFLSNLADKPAHQTAKPTIDQWQAWAHNQPGDCACGIKREACDYHS